MAQGFGLEASIQRICVRRGLLIVLDITEGS
jgi:hypothetical protein